MDEPTSALSEPEVDRLFEVVRDLDGKRDVLGRTLHVIDEHTARTNVLLKPRPT